MVNFKSSCFVESLHLTLKEMPKWAKEGLGEEIHIKVAAKGAEGDNPNGKIVLQTKDGVNAENDPALALVEAMRDGEVPVGSVLTPVAINSAIMLFFFFWRTQFLKCCGFLHSLEAKYCLLKWFLTLPLHADRTLPKLCQVVPEHCPFMPEPYLFLPPIRGKYGRGH